MVRTLCWVCLGVFGTGGEVYDHLAQECVSMQMEGNLATQGWEDIMRGRDADAWMERADRGRRVVEMREIECCVM